MIFDFKVVTEWFDNLLNGFMPAWATTVVECVLIGVGLLVVYALLALFYIYFERKVCGAFQCRLGPNRVGPLGLLQSFADMFKILIKELIPLNNIDKFLFNLAPFLVIVASFAAFAVLPWGKGLQIIDFNIGIFFLTAVSSIGVLGILLAGWSSNNKYTLIGALRSGAQMISYELSIGLAIMTMVDHDNRAAQRHNVGYRSGRGAERPLVHFPGPHSRRHSIYRLYDCRNGRNQPRSV